MSNREDLADRLDELETSFGGSRTLTIRRTHVDKNGDPLPDSEQPDPIVVDLDVQTGAGRED